VFFWYLRVPVAVEEDARVRGLAVDPNNILLSNTSKAFD